MKLSRRQLRLIIENAMEDTLDQLEKAAMPIMDLIVGYHKSRDIGYSSFNVVVTKADIERGDFLKADSFIPKIEQQLKKAISVVDKRSLFAKLDELFSKFVRDGKIEPFVFGAASAQGVDKRFEDGSVKRADGLSIFLDALLDKAAISGMGREGYLDFISSTHRKQYTTIGGPHYVYHLIPSKANEYQEKLDNINKSKFPLTLELRESTK